MPQPPPPTPAPRVAVVQDGARLHYAVPVALQRRGALERMLVEWYQSPGVVSSVASRLADRVRPGSGRRLRERHHPELNPHLIRTNPALALKQARASRRFPTPEAYFAWASDLVGDWIAREGFGDANALFGFIRNVSPALLRAARDQGLATVADQMIAPMLEERRQAALQAERFPQWQSTAEPCDHELVQRVESESWAAADHITCASDYVRDSLISAGQPPEKISVLPYPIDASHYDFVDRSERAGPLRVGFVGGVGLRKGAPYFAQVAERLTSKQIEFVLVGPLAVDPALLSGRPNLKVIGPVPRSEVGPWLAKFDVLLFPSTCEGSPGAVMEALASGLPVVSTPNSGTVVRDGIEGFIRPYDDIDGLAQSIDRLASNPTLRADMSRAARNRAETFNLDAYSHQLLSVFSTALASKHN